MPMPGQDGLGAENDGMTATEPYEVHAIRYAANPAQRAGQNFLGGDPHDRPMPLDYFVWLIRGNGRSFVVDTGFDRAVARERRRDFLACPGETLSRLGLSPDAVQDVIITHLHYDHCGNHDLFPNARYHLQDREMAHATGRCMCHEALRAAYAPADIAAMVGKLFAGRVSFHDGEAELAPGLTMHHVGGHTGGMQVVRVLTRRGWLVLASDASHFYANMEQGRAFPILHDLAAMLEGHRLLYRLAGSPDTVIPGHDPLVTRRYPPAHPELAGLAVRLDADPLSVA